MALIAATTAGLLAVMAGATEWLVRDQAAPQDSWLPHLRMVQAPGSRDLAFGDSHAARGFSAPAPWLNLAYPASTIEQIAATVEHVLAEIVPDRVILQADPHLFAPYRLLREPDAYAEELAADASEPFPLLADDRHRPLLASYWRAFVGDGGILRSQIERTASGALLMEGNLAALAPRALEYAALERARVHHPYPGFREQPAAAAYRDMVERLAAAGAQVCLVAFPVSEAYLAALAETAQPGWEDSYRDALGWFAEVAGEAGATFVDQRRAIADTALFLDVDHLNREGAFAFADRLIDACFAGGPPPMLTAVDR